MTHPPHDEDEIRKRRVPCLIVYLHPFRIVEAKDLSAWTVSIEQINQRSWDYAALHEMVGGIDVGLPQPYHMVVCRDGALALPPIKELHSDQLAIEFFNRCLAALLIGGIYCEATNPDGLDIGSIIDWHYVRSHKSGTAAPNKFHDQIRFGHAPPKEAIALFRPRTASLSHLEEAMKLGIQTLNKIPVMRGEYLLKGVTGIARRDWGSALANLWIIAEQIISHLWVSEVIEPTIAADNNKTRKDQLNDTRTWTASARLELLFQKKVISQETLTFLGIARKARNELSHIGKHPSEYDAKNAYEGICALLSTALSGQHLPLFDLDLADHALSDPFSPPKPMRGEPEFWMEIPKLPGELELEKAETALRRSTRTP